MNDPEWDDEVDVVCTDTGLAALATAISATEEDGEVFLADPSRAPRHGWFGLVRPDGEVDREDDETAAYLAELTADLDLTSLTRQDAALPVRRAGAVVPVRRRPIPAFEGRRLRDWAARCIPSPTGYLYTQVTDWTSTTMDCGDGELFKVLDIGAVDVGDDPIGAVTDWLAGEAQDRGLHGVEVTRFEHLVFDEGVVAGAVFSTPDGPLAVRARHGILMGPGTAVPAEASADSAAAGHGVRVALVGKEASRFGRVELLTADAASDPEA